MGEIKPLTALRGIFALWVLTYHLHALRPSPMFDPFGIMGQGYIGVDFFFLLSGFVLARAYGSRFIEGGSLRTYLNFCAVRAGRIFPLHWAIIAACLIAEGLTGVVYSPGQIFEELALVHRWPFVPAPIHAINGPAWSISVEWLAYLLFPLLVWMTLRVSRSGAFTVFSLAMATVILLAKRHAGSLDLTLANSFAPSIRCLAEFMLGMIAFRWRWVGLGAGVVLASLGVMGLIVIARGAPDFVLVGMMIPGIIAASNNDGLTQNLLTIAPMNWLGKVSFSAYLIHLPVVKATREIVETYLAGSPVQNYVFVSFSLAVTLILSEFSYRLIEAPARDRSKAAAKRLL